MNLRDEPAAGPARRLGGAAVILPPNPEGRDLIASAFCTRLEREINDVIQTAQHGSEAMSLALYYLAPNGERLSVSNVGFHDPDLLIFTVRNSAGLERVLAHVSSVQLLLCLEPVAEGEPPRRPIGFQGPGETRTVAS